MSGDRPKALPIEENTRTVVFDVVKTGQRTWPLTTPASTPHQ